MAATRYRLGIPFGAALIALLAAVASQAAEGPSESPPGSSNSNALQEVVVTALRREENIQNVPISMAAMSQKTIDELHLQNLSDLESVVPGLTFTTPTVFNPNGQSDIAIRGIFSGSASLSPTTQVYLDDTPIEEHIVGIRSEERRVGKECR